MLSWKNNFNNLCYPNTFLRWQHQRGILPHLLWGWNTMLQWATAVNSTPWTSLLPHALQLSQSRHWVSSCPTPQPGKHRIQWAHLVLISEEFRRPPSYGGDSEQRIRWLSIFGVTDKETLIKGLKGCLVPWTPLARASTAGATTDPLQGCNKR